MPDEFALIAEIFAPLAKGDANSFNLTDDAAVVPARAGYDLVVTADMMTAGVHFFADDPADMIARKLLRVNLSDLAAKGAAPHAYLLTVALPRSTSLQWLRAFGSGLAQDQSEFSVHLLGGDTTSTEGPLCLSLTAMGWVAAGRMIRRSGARIGDEIYVTGTIGDATLGLKVRKEAVTGLSAAESDYLLSRYRLPQPRNRLGTALPSLVSAGIDVSDGLAADLGHITQTSNVGAEVQLSQIPFSAAARAGLASGSAEIQHLISGGDDYELLVTIAAGKAPLLIAAGEKAGIPLTRIGRITPGKAVSFLDANGAPLMLTTRGYRHF